MARKWTGRENDDGSIHCLGNGQMCVYEQGPDVMQVSGPPYSSVAIVKLLFSEGENTEVVSERCPGTGIWNHKIYLGGKYAGEMTDFVDSKLPCFARRIKLEQPVSMNLAASDKSFTVNNTEYFKNWNINGAFLLTSIPGTYVYANYPSLVEMSYQVILGGALEVLRDQEDNTANVHLKPGESFIYIAGGPDYPKCMEYSIKALEASFDVMLERTGEWWMDFTGRRHNFSKIIPEGFLHKKNLMETIDDISVLIKAQQSVEGAVLAGHCYLWGAVRDQYGVARCLLALGYFDEARRILDYYFNIWSKRGCLHNGQDIGLDGFFHIHENDEVEITGYLIMQAFDYYGKVKDDNYIRKILPMLEWAWESQKKHLVRHMLPFNGDETYIAGGILPRSALNDGSAEATLLFITGGERFLAWVREFNIWNMEKYHESIELLNQTRKNYRLNFWENATILTNNPLRREGLELPKYRHGVCEAWGLQTDKSHQRLYWFGWTEKTENDRYLCPLCLADGIYLPAAKDKYYLQSVSLLPLYIHSDMFSEEEINLMAARIIAGYRSTGTLPSRPDGNTAVGYDYGLLLYTLTEISHPAAKEIFEKTLEIIDSTGAWVEYYENGLPKGCRCRAWESSINLEALINFALKGRM